MYYDVSIHWKKANNETMLTGLKKTNFLQMQDKRPALGYDCASFLIVFALQLSYKKLDIRNSSISEIKWKLNESEWQFWKLWTKRRVY